MSNVILDTNYASQLICLLAFGLWCNNVVITFTFVLSIRWIDGSPENNFTNLPEAFCYINNGKHTFVVLYYLNKEYMLAHEVNVKLKG